MDLNLSIGAFGLSPFFVAIIELAKQKFGMPVKYTLWANLVLNLVGYVGVSLLTQHPEYLEPTVNWLNIAAGFLMVAGVYDRSEKTVVPAAKRLVVNVYDRAKRIQG
jgi:hypothetical protein